MDIEELKRIMLEGLLEDVTDSPELQQLLRDKMDSPGMQEALQSFAEEKPERAQAWIEHDRERK